MPVDGVLPWLAMVNPPNAPVHVPKIRTSVSDRELRATIKASIGDIAGTPQGEPLTKALYCQLAEEHNAGADVTCPADSRAGWNVWCYNFGNRRGPTGDLGVYLDTARENINGASVSVAGAWPAYGTPAGGMISWVSLLRTHYYTAWSVVLRGAPVDLVAYGNALKQAGYYTAHAQAYDLGMVTWGRIYDRTDWGN